MKKIIFSVVLVSSMLLSYAQVPEAFSYQTVVRDASGNLINNRQVSFRISILTGSSIGQDIYSETHSVTTNGFGLANLKIGMGENKTGLFSPTGWGVDKHYIKIEIDINGGNSFSLMGTSELLSVPYAFHAQTVEEDKVDDVDADPTNEIQTLSIMANQLTLSKGGGTVLLPETANVWKKEGNNAYYNDGNAGIGTTSPVALLHVNGTGTGQGNVLFEGEYKVLNQGNPPISDAGTRMMWYPDKAAFRAGIILSDEWDKGNIGDVSTALGFNTKAAGIFSIAMGRYAEALSEGSIAMGAFTTASGDYSTAIGTSTSAPGRYSTSIGYETRASSSYCTSIGINNMGLGDPWNWVHTDPLFEIGNGYTGKRNNAFTVLKNGNIGIGTAAPAFKLDIEGILNLNRGGTGIAMRVNEQEAIWYNGKYFSWGYGGDYNYFADPVTIKSSGVPGYDLVVNGNAAKIGGGSWSVLSDARLKNIRGNYNKGLKEIIALQPVRFTYKEGNPRQLSSSNEQIGFVAQEVQSVFPEAVSQCKDGFLDFNMHAVNVALVNSVKELNDKLQKLEEENSQLKTRVNILASQFEEFKLVIETTTRK